MRNYVRYIVLLILIIAGGLLIISVVNKFTEPDVLKLIIKIKQRRRQLLLREKDLP